MAALSADLATDADEPALRQMLRENPIPGAIELTFEREPAYFRAAAIEGPLHQSFVMRNAATREIVGMASRAVRSVYVNGRAQPVGYISQLRVKRDFAWGLSLARYLASGFAFQRQLHADGRAPFYLCSIVADNAPARRLLASGLKGLPHFREYCRVQTYAVLVRRGRPARPTPGKVRIVRGTPELAGQLLACLARNGARRQFAPEWTSETLFHPQHTPNLSPEDFFVALKGARVVGCLARWDQSGFKQVVVRGYRGALGRGRPWLNLAARLGGWPSLPPPGTALRHSYASHLALDDDDPAIFAALWQALYAQAQARGDSFCLLGLSAADPLAAVITRSYRHIAYASVLYLVAWEDGRDAAAQVDGRLTRPEIAVL